MEKTISEADKYEMVMLKRLGIKHREVNDYLEQKDIDISSGEINNIIRL